MLRLTDILIGMQPQSIQISGGEPLLVKDFIVVAERIAAAKIPIAVYLGGFGVDEARARDIARLFTWIHLSLDGADAATHDQIRGKSGSFAEVMSALSIFNQVATEVRQAGGRRTNFGIDCSVVQSNFHQLDRFCSEIAPRFPALRFLNLRSAYPSGLASTEAYAERELLTVEQSRELRGSAFAARLRVLTPTTVDRVSVSDALALRMGPEGSEAAPAPIDLMHVEPDGLVRGMPLYEGTVGNLLREPPEVIWSRVRERHADPFVTNELAAVHTMQDWAAAVRKIDRRFASEVDQLRLLKRKDQGTGAGFP